MTPPNEPPKKVRYTSVSVERHIDAPRLETWDALLAVLAAEPLGFGSEKVLSFEAPWRRSAEIDNQTLDFLQITYVLRDDIGECHIAAAIVVDPEPTPEGVAVLEQVVSAVGAVLDAVLDEAHDNNSGS